jgi:hypothetical protein
MRHVQLSSVGCTYVNSRSVTLRQVEFSQVRLGSGQFSQVQPGSVRSSSAALLGLSKILEIENLL